MNLSKPNKMTRGDFLYQTTLASLSLNAIPNLSLASDAVNSFPNYGWLRGFNMVPSWGARIEDAWWYYDGDRMRDEVSLAKQVHANCIRLWIDYSAWMRDPYKIVSHFMDAVNAIDESGMKTMPCLFNRWHQAEYDYGGTYIDSIYKGNAQYVPYVKSLVLPLVNDERILIWDLCNEPQAFSPYAKEMTDEVREKEFEWLRTIGETVRECGARQPITVGTMRKKDIELYEPLCDVLCAHTYSLNQKDLEAVVDDLDQLRLKFDKPLIVNECMPGALDDLQRAEIVQFSSTLLEAAGTGWMGWALKEGLAVSTRKDRLSGPSPNNDGYYPFFTKEGKLREGLDFLRNKPKFAPPWKQ